MDKSIIIEVKDGKNSYECAVCRDYVKEGNYIYKVSAGEDDPHRHGGRIWLCQLCLLELQRKIARTLAQHIPGLGQSSSQEDNKPFNRFDYVDL